MASKAAGTALTLIPAFIIALAGTYFANYLLLNHDAAFFLNCADRLLHGAQLYKDIMDNNTPMIIFLSTIPVMLHMFTGLPLAPAFFLCAFVLLWGGFWFGWTILRNHPAFRRPVVSCISLALLSYALFALPDLTRDFGQREQLFCALIFPYVALLLISLAGVQSNEMIKLTAAILAGIGICLKPHFLLIFFAAEGFYAWQTRSLHFYRRIEPVAILLLLAFYYLMMLLHAHDYIFEYAPHMLYTLSAYQSPMALVFLVGLITTILPTCCMLLAPRKSPYRKGVYLILALIYSTALIFIVEKASFAYHIIPELFFIILMLGFIASSSITRLGTALPLIVAGGLMFFTSGGEDIQASVESAIEPRTIILELADALKPYDSVIVFGGSVSPGFPAVIYAGTRWRLHNACVCYVASDYIDQRESAAIIYHSPSQMMPPLRYFQDMAIGDIAKLPAAIVVNESPVQQALPENFDFIAHFMKDSRFLPAWSHYRLARNVIHGTGKFAIYERVD